MSRGSIRRRGRGSWELKFDVGTDGQGKRQTRYVTVKGKRSDAQRELIKLLSTADGGTFVEASRVTVAEYLRGWLGSPPDAGEQPPAPPAGLTAKTAERY